MILRQIMLCAIILGNILAINAQTSKITSFYAVKFGDSRSTIENVIRSQGQEGKWKKNIQTGEEYYEVDHVKLGSVKFHYAQFYVSDNKLSKASFIFFQRNSDAGGGNRMYDEENNIMESVSSEKFSLMKHDLSSKYGIPVLNTERKCIWKSGNNQILLENKSEKYTENFWGLRTENSNYKVKVEYSTDKGNVNF